MPSADFCTTTGCLTTPPVPTRNTAQTSRGKNISLHRTPAEFTTPALDGYGLHDHLLTRPTGIASYPVPVRQAATLPHASSRPRLTTTPLRFANPSPPSGWVEDFHLQANIHARHTREWQTNRCFFATVGSLRKRMALRWRCSRIHAVSIGELNDE